jgi:hypothetical protein
MTESLLAAIAALRGTPRGCPDDHGIPKTEDEAEERRASDAMEMAFHDLFGRPNGDTDRARWFQFRSTFPNL